jgi:hypothetical protein
MLIMQTILIICVGQSFSFILQRPIPFTDAHACKWTNAIYSRLGKKTTSSINKVTTIILKIRLCSDESVFFLVL